MQKRIFSIALLVSAIVLFQGCNVPEWFKEKFGCSDCVSEKVPTAAPHASQKNAAEEVVITINGKPTVTAEDFERSFQMLMQSQQALQQVLPLMAEDQQLQLFQQIAENLAAERLAGEWIKRQGVDKTAEYLENARIIHEAVDRDLAARTFQQELIKKIEISDAQAKSYYESNKDKNPYFKRAPFVSGSLGVKAQTVTFDTEKDAKDFADKAKKGNFTTAAQDAKKTVKDLGLVVAQSDVDNAIKAKALAISKAPAIEVVKDGNNKFVVIHIISKQEPQTVPFDQVQNQVKEVMLSDKFQDMYLKEIDKLKKEYNVSINQDFLKQLVSALRPAQPVQAEKKETVQHAKPHSA